MGELRDLVIFSLGPVQSFIATARRTQDLWMGSQLLSSLALVGVQEVERLMEDKVEFIAPVKTTAGEWPQDIPNRFVVVVPAGQGEGLGLAVSTAVQAAWRLNVAEAVWKHVFDQQSPRPDVHEWQRQVRTWLEMYWIAWPWDPVQDYGTAYRRAGLALSARKQVRDFPTLPELGEKCTLCGIRAALHERDAGSRREVRAFWDAWQRRLGTYVLRTGERLCAVCSIKRLVARAEVRLAGRTIEPEERFPSTSSVATIPFRTRLAQNWNALQAATTAHLDAARALGARSGAPFARPEMFQYRDLVSTQAQYPASHSVLKYDGDFFYRENFAPELLSNLLGREPEAADLQQAAQAQRTLAALLKATGELELPPPHPYLAVLALDGDRMGALLGSCDTVADHQKISRALARFAQDNVPHIVEQQYAGRLVYAGGDDVLALLPVEHVLGAADALRQELTVALEGAGYPGRTASAGIAIVHHTHALEGALIAARAAERAAKHERGRNALVVTFLRRSGEPTEMGINWTYGDRVPGALQIILEMEGLFLRQALSSKLAYDLRSEAPALAALPQEACTLELARLLNRHWQQFPREAYQAERMALAARLAELAGAGMGIEALAEWLLLARFLAQGGELA